MFNLKSLFPSPTHPNPNGSHIQAQPVWMGQGDVLDIAGLRITNPLLYVTQPPYTPIAGKWALDPALAISPDQPDFVGRGLGYWPDYRTLTPRGRLAYLRWHAEGRQRTDLHPGYVLLFVYGLERRLLLDQSPSDVKTILLELQELLQTYRAHGSIRKVVCELVDVFELATSGRISLPNPIGLPGTHSAVAIKSVIGDLILGQKPIPAPLLLHWLAVTPWRKCQLPAAERMSEFSGFFAEYVGRLRPRGLVFGASNAQPLGYIYQAASGDFSICLNDRLRHLPDIDSLKPAKLEAEMLLRSAVEQFERRFRRTPWAPVVQDPQPVLVPTATDTPPAHSAPEFGRESVQELAREHARSGEVMSLRAALKRFRGMTPNQLIVSEVTRLANTLADAGLGIVPDPRFDLDEPRLCDEVMVCELGAEALLQAPSPAYRNALFAIMVAMTLARSDGDLADVEVHYASQIINAFPDLKESERNRLSSEIEWLKRFPIPHAPILAALEGLSRTDRSKLARTIADIVKADGHISNDEFSYAARLYRGMGLSEADLNAALGITSSPAYANVAIKATSPADPVAEAAVKTDVSQYEDDEIDATVLALLDDLSASPVEEEDPFDDEDVEIFEQTPRAPSHQTFVSAGPVAAPTVEEFDWPPVEGLDERHSAFLRELMRRTEVNRRELERIAREHRLMAFGAIEHINDCIATQFGEPLLEIGDDEVARLNEECEYFQVKGAA